MFRVNHGVSTGRVLWFKMSPQITFCTLVPSHRIFCPDLSWVPWILTSFTIAPKEFLALRTANLSGRQMLFVLILRFYFCKEIKLLCFLSFLVHSVNFAIIPSVSRFAQLHFNLHLVQVLFSLLQPILISLLQPHLFGPL